MEYTFKFTENEVNLILNALASLPYAQVYNVIHSIQSQVSLQQTQSVSEDVVE